jgi:hypothetical protein
MSEFEKMMLLMRVIEILFTFVKYILKNIHQKSNRHSQR